MKITIKKCSVYTFLIDSEQLLENETDKKKGRHLFKTR